MAKTIVEGDVMIYEGWDAVAAFMLLLPSAKPDKTIVVRAGEKRYAGFWSLAHAEWVMTQLGITDYVVEEQQ
jgi:hypothetical protein